MPTSSGITTAAQFWAWCGNTLSSLAHGRCSVSLFPTGQLLSPYKKGKDGSKTHWCTPEGQWTEQCARTLWTPTAEGTSPHSTKEPSAGMGFGHTVREEVSFESSFSPHRHCQLQFPSFSVRLCCQSNLRGDHMSVS